jgi:chromosome segregation ATPase
MEGISILIIGLVEAIVLSGALFFLFSKSAGGSSQVLQQIDGVITERKEILSQFEEIQGQLVNADELRKVGKELMEVLESLKAERGRNTITQAELETVEGRLRELEEIERELEASGIETKEELKILNKKQKDLGAKNDSLKEQIAASLSQIDQLVNDMQMSAELQTQIDMMKTQLVMTQQKIDTLLMNIEQGNEQYFILKNRYDALDIEYAQLFEKFSETEAALSAKKG